MSTAAADIPAQAQAELARLAPNVRRRFEAALAGPEAGCALEQLQRLADARQRGPGPAPPDHRKSDPRVTSDNPILNMRMPY